jgi:hypothetical protein
MRIEAARQAVRDLPITPSVLATLRATARLFSTHYSTMIEGNLLTPEQVREVIGAHQHFPGRERDEKEVLGGRETGRLRCVGSTGASVRRSRCFANAT